jgi:hypothetical protein
MKKLRIKKSDAYRLLLTEVLPYETPLFFSNTGIYSFLKKHKNLKPAEKLINDFILNRKGAHTIPFNYKINKDSNTERTLSIIHPSSQIEISQFIYENDNLIINLCSKSTASLRHPAKVASHFYEREYAQSSDNLKNNKVETDSPDNDSQEKNSSSYFAYKDYSYLYKFYDSYHFHQAERKFKKLLKFDISKCFPHIYTHTICWAVKDKEFAKANKKNHSFEKTFDSLMQNCNYAETNGIVVGPEVSRIFAEIILQKIDMTTIANLALKSDSITHKKDFIIKRYVDDYFLFYNNDDHAETIFREFKSELEIYKLYINESKNEYSSRPFISNITTAKIEVGELLSTFIEKNTPLATTDENINGINTRANKSRINNPSRTANFLIRDFKSVIKKNNVAFSSISGKSLSMFKTGIINIIKLSLGTEIKNRHAYKNIILTIIEASFFICSMDMRVRSTYNILQIISSITESLDHFDFDTKDHIQKKIYDELNITLTSITSFDSSKIERINLLLGFKMLDNQHQLTTIQLAEFSRLSLDETQRITAPSNLDYFETTSLLYCIQKNNSKLAKNIREHLSRTAFDKIIHCKNFLQDTELTCLFLDLLSNPKILKSSKNNVAMHFIKQTNGGNPKPTEINAFINFVEARSWFIDWRSGLNFSQLLAKKELQIVY